MYEAKLMYGCSSHCAWTIDKLEGSYSSHLLLNKLLVIIIQDKFSIQGWFTYGMKS